MCAKIYNISGFSVINDAHALSLITAIVLMILHYRGNVTLVLELVIYNYINL